MAQGKRLISNTLWNIFSLAISMATGIVMTPLILHNLGKNVYGIWALTGSLFAYSQLLSLGLNSAVNLWIPKYLVNKNKEGIDKVVNTALAANIVAAIILSMAVVVMVYGFPYWFNIPSELHAVSRLTVAIVGAGFTILVALNVFTAVLSGFQRYDYIAISDIVTSIGRLIGIIVVLYSGYALIALAMVYALSNSIKILFNFILVRKKFADLKINLSMARKQTFREMFGYSGNTLLYSSGQIIQQQAALILIGATLGTAAVAEYSIPLFIIGVIGSLVTSLSMAIKPATTYLDAGKQVDQVRQLFLLGTKYSLLIVLPIALFLFFYGTEVMSIWLKKDYVGSSANILFLLMISAIFQLWLMPAFYVVVGLGKHFIFGIATLLKAAISLLLGGIMVVWLKLGVYGVAIGFSIPEILIAVVILGPYCCRSVGITFWKEIKECIIPSVFATLPLIFILVLTKYYFEPISFEGMIALIGVSAVVTAVGIWQLGLSYQEKWRFIEMLPLLRLFARQAN